MKFSCPQDWDLVKLSDLGEVNRGRSRHRPRHAPHLYGGPFPFIQTGDIKSSGGRITTFQQTYSEAGLKQSRLWPSGTLCITIAANIAETSILQFPACFPDSVIGFIADPEKCDVHFIEYTFRYIRRLIQHAAKDSGTVQDNINLGTFEGLRFPIPKLHEQKAITRILGALDDKIELNRQMNHTLEAIAQALFKSWFLDFDPVTAKAAGRKPYGMNEATAALFPNRFVESELGLIPEGWQISRLGDSVDLATGKSYTSEDLQDSTTALVTLKSFYRGGGYRHDGLKPYIGSYKQEQVINNGELIVACTDVTQAAEVIGRPAIVISDSRYSVLIASLDVIIVRPRISDTTQFFYQLMRSTDYVNHIVGYTNGTTVLHLSKEGLPTYRFVYPSEKLINLFSKISLSIFAKIGNNFREFESLTVLRDALLPKLLSGEIRVMQAEKIVAEAV